MKIEVYLTAENGDGYSQGIGVYDDWSEIKLRVGMFSKDSVITFDVMEKDE